MPAIATMITLIFLTRIAICKTCSALLYRNHNIPSMFISTAINGNIIRTMVNMEILSHTGITGEYFASHDHGGNMM